MNAVRNAGEIERQSIVNLAEVEPSPTLPVARHGHGTDFALTAVLTLLSLICSFSIFLHSSPLTNLMSGRGKGRVRSANRGRGAGGRGRGSGSRGRGSTHRGRGSAATTHTRGSDSQGSDTQGLEYEGQDGGPAVVGMETQAASGITGEL